MTRVAIPFVLAIFLLTGCVERRIYFRSDPPGADVYIDGEYIDRTRPEDHTDGPLYANFIFYGKREYTIRKPGFETVSGTVDLVAPWYEYPPIDFFAEVLAPWPIIDEHEVTVKLEPAKPADVEALYTRARNFKYSSRPEERYEYAHYWRHSTERNIKPKESTSPDDE